MIRLLLATCFSLVATIALAQNKNVGIGTTAPEAQLHTTGSVRFDTLAGAGTRLVFTDAQGRLVPSTPPNTAIANAQIPDGGCGSSNGVSLSITVTGQPASVASANIRVRVNIAHTYNSDVQLYLISPTGAILRLISNNGGSSDNFTNTVFWDGASQTLPTGSTITGAPFTGQYKPRGGLTAICSVTPTVNTFGDIGGGTVNPNGTWTLVLFDDTVGGGVGQLINWGISFTDSDPLPPAFSYVTNAVLKSSNNNLASSSLYEVGGKVGVGTAAPEANLDVVGTTLGLRTANSWDNLWLSADGGTASINASGADAGLNFRVGDNTTGTYGNGQTLTTAMTMLPNGNTGFGITTPAARLHVADSSVLFSAAGNIGTPGIPPASGAGRRAMWWSGKAAFRTGYVSADQWDNNNIGNYSVAGGFNTIASNRAATAFGEMNTASGSWSAVAGFNNVASGVATTAFGTSNEASGDNSFAAGQFTRAVGDASVALGKSNFAPSYNEVAVGGFNVNYTASSAEAYVATDRVFSVGNGNEVTRSNALTILKNGNVGIGTTTPGIRLDVQVGNNTQALRLAAGSGQTDNNGILIIQDNSNNTAGGTNNELVEFLNASGSFIGTISRTSGANSISYNTTSDARLKTGIRPTRYGLRDLMNIQVTDYKYKGFSNAASQTGFLAQQLYSIYPEAVTKGNDADEKQPYMVDYSKLTPLLVKGVQELKAENDALKQENKVRMDALQRENEALKAEVAEMKAMLKTLLKKKTR